jgi:hypothetical protein
MCDKTSTADYETRGEEADHFDNSDNFTEEWEHGQPVRVRRAYDRLIQVRLDAEMDREAQRLADALGAKKSTLSRQWLQERIQTERERRASRSDG